MPVATPDQTIAAYQRGTQIVRDRVVAYVRSVWSMSPGFRDADVDRIVARIVPAIRAGQMQTAALTDAYIGRMAVLAGVSWTPGLDPNVVGYRGVPDAVVYRRPAVDVYTALSKGATYAQAVSGGLSRLTDIVSTDIQQASTRQAQSSVDASGFKYFRRQLTGRESCAFCVIASTQRYHRGNLLPCHPGCDCTVVPIVSAKDPGQVIDRRLLESTRAQIDTQLGSEDRGARDLGLGKTTSAGNSVSDYTDLLIVHDHGEFGPTLAWRSQEFTSAADISALN